MEARKIELSEKAQPFAYRAEWEVNLRMYEDSGLVNHNLLEWIALQSRWYEEWEKTPLFNFSKPILDKCVAAAAIIALLPFCLLIAATISLTSRGMPIYSQVRIGQFGRPFRIYKFRTMYQGTTRAVYNIKKTELKNDMKGGLFKDSRDRRVTPFGKWLRRWSLDEVPQLLNILIGEMSLVGPRPLVLEDTATVPNEYFSRFVAKPGLTGLWQSTIRESRDGRAKLALDAEYALQRCWRLDLQIIARTIVVVLHGKGAW